MQQRGRRSWTWLRTGATIFRALSTSVPTTSELIDG
jgi:hypothetical protein